MSEPLVEQALSRTALHVIAPAFPKFSALKKLREIMFNDYVVWTSGFGGTTGRQPSAPPELEV